MASRKGSPQGQHVEEVNEPGEVRIGISGWRYEGWRGVFYPEGLPQRNELKFASRALPTIEINGSFYSLQDPESYAAWHDDTPEGFVFAVKGPQYITHNKRLHDIDTPLANFLASGVLGMNEKLGPMLWQFPPNFRFDAALFEDFLRRLPHDTQAALDMAKGRDSFMHERELLQIDTPRRMRHAIEIRHESFVDEAFVELLRRYDVGLVVADTAGKFPYIEEVTTDFMYLRLHGDQELYASGYSDSALDRWADRIDAWRRGGQPDDAKTVAKGGKPVPGSKRIYCYFDNDIKVKAPFDAARLMRRLGLDATLNEAGHFEVVMPQEPQRGRRHAA